MTEPAGARRDPRSRTFLPPVRLVWSEGIEAPERVLHDDLSTVALPPGASLILDFGRELNGGLRLDVPTTTPKGSPQVRVRFGESVSETLGVPDQDHALHDHAIRLAWMGRTEVGETGFRFVRLDNTDPETTIHLRYAEAVRLQRDDPRLGRFTCSDPLLNTIWEVGADTVHLCMQDHVWDGIKRDRLVWIGDLHPEALVIACVFGAHPIVPASLDFVRDQTPLPGWMNGISSYSLWWLLIQADWWRFSGDRAYLAEQRDYLTGLLAQLEGRLSAEGDERLDGHRFLEWPTARDSAAIDAGLQALMALALRAGSELLAVLGEAERAAHYAALATRAQARPRSTHSKQAAALNVLAGMQAAGGTNDALLAVDPLRGISTFYGYYVLQARAQAGDMAGCLELLRGYWGGMLAMGATSFWESFEIDWMPGATRIDELPVAGRPDIHADFGDHCYVGLRHSLCHGWAAGPTAFLMTHVLGLTPAEPGFAAVRVAPQLGGLDWAEGVLPTPHGIIAVHHERRADGTVQTKLTLPDGVRRAGS